MASFRVTPPAIGSGDHFGVPRGVLGLWADMDRCATERRDVLSEYGLHPVHERVGLGDGQVRVDGNVQVGVNL